MVAPRYENGGCGCRVRIGDNRHRPNVVTTWKPAATYCPNKVIFAASFVHVDMPPTGNLRVVVKVIDVESVPLTTVKLVSADHCVNAR